MIEKYIEIEPYDDYGQNLFLIDPNVLEKTAGYGAELEEFIRNIRPVKGKIYVLVNAVSAGDYYGCVDGGSLIATESGEYKKIRDIEVGEKVLTGQGNFKRVVKVFKNPSPKKMLELRVNGLPDPIITTSSHPFLSLRRKETSCLRNKNIDCLPNAESKKFICLQKPAEKYNCFERELDLSGKYRRLSTLDKKDWILSPIINNEVKNPTHDSSLFAKLLGYFAAEGSFRKFYSKKTKKFCYTGIRFAFGKHEETTIAQDCNQILKKLGYDPKIKVVRSITEIECYDKELAKKVLSYIGEHSKRKKISDKIFKFSDEEKLLFLSGYADGDGYFKINKDRIMIIISTASKNLALGVQRLLWSLNFNSAISKIKKIKLMTCDHFHIYFSVPKKHNFEKYSHYLGKKAEKSEKKVQRRQQFAFKDYAFLKIKKIEEISYDAPVYNIEVENDHSYTIQNIAVANSNKNGDYISEEVLKKYFKTYEVSGIYKHHLNKDPRKSLGKVLLSHYNPQMHRVELILEIDEARAGKLGEDLKAGKLPKVSFGLRTATERCSICDHVSHKISERCDHLKYHLNKILPGGKKVYMINDQAKFFDISFVTVPADKIAGTLAKVASVQILEKKGDTPKKAEITKKVEGKVEAASTDPKNLIYKSQPDIPEDKAIQLGKNHPLNELLSTMLGLRIMPKPIDFQRMVLSAGNRPQRQTLVIRITKDTKPVIPDDICVENFNEKIAHEILDLVPDRTLTKPLVFNRIIKYAADFPPQLPSSPSIISRLGKLIGGGEKEEPLRSPLKNPAVPLSVLSGLYLGYSKLMNRLDPMQMSILERLVVKHPWLLPLFIGGASLGAIKLQENLMKTSAMNIPLASIFLTVPAAYLYGGLQEYKVRKGKAVTDIQNFIRKHPLLSAGLTSGSLYTIPKLLKTGAFDNESLYMKLGSENFEKLWKSLIGG